MVYSCKDGKNPSESNDTLGDTNEYLIDLNNSIHSVLNAIGGAKKLDDVPGQSLPVVVIRIAEDEVVVLSSQCTHAGCEVNLPADGKIVCPCHNSQFNLQGNVLSGPASEPLAGIQASIDDNTIALTIG